MDQNRKQGPSDAENISRKAGVSPLNARHVNVMQRLPKQTGVAAADHCQEKWLHFLEAIRQLGGKRLDNGKKAADCTPAMPRFVDSETVRQSIHEPEDAYRVVQGYADLLQREASLFLIWQELIATRSGLKSVNDSVRSGIAGDFSRAPSA